MTNRSEQEVPKRRTWAAHTKLTARTKKATVDLNGSNEDEDVRAEEVKECEGDETPSAAVARYQMANSVHETYYKCRIMTQGS